MDILCFALLAVLYGRVLVQIHKNEVRRQENEARRLAMHSFMVQIWNPQEDELPL